MAHIWTHMLGVSIGLVYVLGTMLPLQAQTASRPTIQVLATVPDLGDLVQVIGRAHVKVTVCAKGTEDAHFVEAKPSFIKALSQADAYIQIGLDLEAGWAPTLLTQARNSRVLPGTPGYLDASMIITPLQVPSGPLDRSMGDVHPAGNPHYLLDPVRGLQVARLIRDRLAMLQPMYREDFEAHYATFRQELGAALVGAPLAAKYDVEKLALLADHNRLDAFLQSQGEAALLGGWLGRMQPYRGAKVVADHNQWVYFTQRFGLETIGFMEPKPGVTPDHTAFAVSHHHYA